MKRIISIVSIVSVGAALLAAVPVTMGLVGNASFAQSVPVRVPAQVSLLDDNGGQPTTPTGTSTTEAGDDNGRHGSDDTTIPTSSPTSEAGDDNGGHGSDDSTATSSSSPSSEATDGETSVSGSGSDDNGGHGSDDSSDSDDSSHSGGDDGSGHS